ncbi:MAG: hypothetical protein AB1Z23_08370 [Eubacteriales bacterium]
MIKEEIKRRSIPPLLDDDLSAEKWDESRKKIIKIFSENVYGNTPYNMPKTAGKVVSEDKITFAGKATHRNILLSFDTPKGEFSFPFDIVSPNTEDKVPLFVFLSFHTYKESYETPIEEIIDAGYALAVIHYEIISQDNFDMQSKLAGMFPRAEHGDTWGKYGIWAYALSRVMDYVQTLTYIDHKSIACVGHSRLGKTALWCCVQDDRFCAVFANNSGCSGAAITRRKRGETVKDICTKFPYWFCENYQQFMDREDEMPFDQHQLVAAMAPRLFYTCSASKDIWADPESEYISCLLASEIYEKMGLQGFLAEDRYPVVGDVFNEGRIGYHMRYGEHFLSRYDWNKFIEFMNKHIEKG